MITHSEANFAELGGINDQSTIEDESRLAHLSVHSSPVNLLELGPFGSDDHRLSAFGSLEDRVGNGDRFLD